MEPSTGIKTWQWVVTAIVVIVLIIIGIIVFGGNKSGTTDTTGTDTTLQASDTPNAPVNAIDMNDQYPGNVVYVNSVQVAQSSWVVIRKDNNGQPGTVIGTGHFDVGNHPGKITLTQPTVDGGIYYAVLYTDDGSGKFSATADTTVKDAAGNDVLHLFHASVTAGNSIKG